MLVGPTGEPGRFLLGRQALGLTIEAARTTWRVRVAVARDYLTSSPLRYLGTWIRHSRDDLPRGHAVQPNRDPLHTRPAGGIGR